MRQLWAVTYSEDFVLLYRSAAPNNFTNSITFATEQGFPFFGASGTIILGWARVEEKQREEEITQRHQGVAAYRATGAEMFHQYLLALLAGANEKVDQVEQGLSVLTEMLETVEKTEERFYEAELYRLKGKLTLQKEVKVSSSQPLALSTQVAVEAAACFLKAIDIAQKQQAKSLELHATMSLARLWQQQDKRAEAHHLLSKIYNWFTEGFDTKDLQEAKALLGALDRQ
jgi:predicted ATPase